MAKNKSTVYLGYEDEEITLKHLHSLNSNVNKIGGVPDWPVTDIKIPNCPLCGTARPLVVQLYAPLEQSQFHRTLYIFACLNPTCSQNSKSWLCVRTQHLDTVSQTGEIIIGVNSSGSAGKKKKSAKQAPGAATMQTHNISWCSGSDDWGTAPTCGDGAAIEEMDTEADSAEVLDFNQQNEENGNVIETNDNSPIRLGGAVVAAAVRGSEEEDDDEDEESNSMENDLICGFGLLEMQSAQNANDEDPNANCAGGIAAAAVGGGSAVAGAAAAICAEIEDGESDVVFVETPKKPERDLIALLKHTPTSTALGPLAKVTDVTIKPFFVAVDIEFKQRSLDEYEHYGGALSADHIRELYQEYKRQDESLSPNLGVLGGVNNGAGAAEEQETYEKALPAHGDVIFHQFVSTIHQNPGQILRYSRDTLPLLTAPLTEPIPKCQNCNGETICEVQILPTLIPKLRLQQNCEAAPIEFGNVLTFTCLKSCWDTPDKMRYEKIIVQAEN